MTETVKTTIEDHRADEENVGYEYYNLRGEPVRVVFDTQGRKMGGDRLNAKEARFYRAATVISQTSGDVYSDEISASEFYALCERKILEAKYSMQKKMKSLLDNEVVRKFRNQVTTVQPATLSEIESVEEKLGWRLPDSYREFQLVFGDFDHNELIVYTVTTSDENIFDMNTYIYKYGSDVLHCVYNGDLPNVPERYLVFAEAHPVYYCFDKLAENRLNQPIYRCCADRGSRPNLEKCADSFQEWLVDMILEFDSQ